MNLPINKEIEETNDLTGRAIGKLQWRGVLWYSTMLTGAQATRHSPASQIGFLSFPIKNAFCNLFHLFTMYAYCIFNSLVK